MCLKEHHLTNLKKLKYIPVGLGKEKFSEEWMKDDSGENISHKNSNYGEYTFYFWFWKNMLKYIKDGSWVGFTGYRYHWSQNNKLKSEEITKLVNKNNFENYIMKKIPKEWNNFDCVLGEKIFINKWKTSKILKYAKKSFF